MKHLLTTLLLVLALGARANDGIYYTSGNFLVPIAETDISVAKEILTITIGKDSLAMVDVYYEFFNGGEAKTVTMAFEAEAPAGDMWQPLNQQGVHPCIKDFTVTMNGKTLVYDNKVIAIHFGEAGRVTDFTPLDMTQWKGVGDVDNDFLPSCDCVYNASLDSITSFAYGYFFKAPFAKGKNIVHHTYSFRMSRNVTEKFLIPYWLTPATRWANNQVDDFTLRIKAEAPVQEFCMADAIFEASPFTMVGDGDIYEMTTVSEEHFAFVRLGNDAVLEWHGKNFSPTEEMTINSPERVLMNAGWSDLVVVDKDGMEYRFVGDCGEEYLVMAQDYGLIPKKGSRTYESSPFNGTGWVVAKEPGRYNVRQQPTTKSPVVGTITYEEGYLPEAYPCLDQVQEPDTWYWWFKIRYGDKVGYIRTDLADWHSLNL